jgi:ABC-2 type transport system permease protein
VTTATVAFWWIDSGQFANGFTYGGRDFTSYPITVYNGAFRVLFAYGLGFAFIAYTPTVTLLGRPDPTGLPAVFGWLGTPMAASVLVVVAALVWRSGVRHYRSTGS